MPRKQIRIVTPGQIVFHIFLLAIIALFSWSLISGLLANADPLCPSLPSGEVERHLRAVERRVHAGEDAIQCFIVPEGAFLANVFYGYSLINLAVANREDSALRNKAIAEIESILNKTYQYRSVKPFSQTEKSLPGGIIFCGNYNRLMAGYIMLGGTSKKIINEFHVMSDQIARAFMNTNPPFPESYWGLTWPVDGVCALDSLRLHDEIFQTKYSAATERWLAWMKGHLDSQTGLMIAQAARDKDEVVDGTRGCAMSWSLAVLPNLDPDFAREQYKLFRKEFFVPFGWGLMGIQEWYQGIEKPSEFKPGPVVGTLGAAATGLGIAATRANSDWESWHGILRALELLGAPLSTLYGEKTYFLGQSLLCDSIALWGKTIVPWHASPAKALNSAAGAAPPAVSIVLIATIALAAGALAGLIVWRIVKLACDKSFVRPPLNQTVITVACIQTLLLLKWLSSPTFSLMQVLIIMAITNLLEEMLLRPRIVARIFRDEEQANK